MTYHSGSAIDLAPQRPRGRAGPKGQQDGAPQLADRVGTRIRGSKPTPAPQDTAAAVQTPRQPACQPATASSGSQAFSQAAAALTRSCAAAWGSVCGVASHRNGSIVMSPIATRGSVIAASVRKAN